MVFLRESRKTGWMNAFKFSGQNSIMAKVWEHAESVVAQKFFKNQVGGLFRKQILLKPDEVGLIERDGRVGGKIGPGRHTVSNIFNRELTEIILVDQGIKSMRRDLEELWTRDDRRINSTVEIRFRVISPDKLFSNLMRDRSVLGFEDLYGKISVEFLARVITPEVKKRRIDELYGNREILEKLRESIEVDLKKTLGLWGMELVSFALIWSFPPEYEKYLESRGVRKQMAEEREAEHEEALKAAEHGRELENIKAGAGLSREAVKAGLERERLKREFELEMGKKETQEDMREALEALRLKDIKGRQKLLKKAKRRKLGV